MEDTLTIAILTMGGLSLFFAAFLAIADKKLRVDENPLIGKIVDLLPGANCGGCGFAGCYDYATKVVEGKASPTGCPVNTSENNIEIGKLMGIEVDTKVKMVARVLCNGGNAEANYKMTEYYGPMSCATMDILSGGEKLCFYGCLGAGDCVSACPFNAIFINPNGLPVVIDELCTGCGLCAKACPRDVIEIHPIDRNIFIFCKNHDDPKTSTQVCKVACTGCGTCARKSQGAIQVENYLGKIDYAIMDQVGRAPIELCRTGALKQITNNGNAN